MLELPNACFYFEIGLSQLKLNIFMHSIPKKAAGKNILAHYHSPISSAEKWGARRQPFGEQLFNGLQIRVNSFHHL